MKPIELENETGEFLLSHYGNGFALGFKGDEQFIDRGYNFSVNFGVTNGSLLKESEKMSYVLTTKEKLFHALKLYYYGRVLGRKEIPVNIDLETNECIVDEKQAEELAEKHAKFFMENVLKEVNFMFDNYFDRFLKIEEKKS